MAIVKGSGHKFSKQRTDISVPGIVSPVTIDLSGAVPVGGIIPHYDFNSLVSFDNNIWKYCNGSVVSDVTSPLNGQTLPDLSNRYLVGFGTESGGDIGSAAFSATAVGNASHQISLLHSHTVNAHSHTVNSHVHDSGTLRFIVSNVTNVGGGEHRQTWYTSGGTYGDTFSQQCSGSASSIYVFRLNGGTAPGDLYTKSSGAFGSTGSASPGTDSQSPGTNNALSSTQDIQPRSIRVRYIMRIK